MSQGRALQTAMLLGSLSCACGGRAEEMAGDGSRQNDGDGGTATGGSVANGGTHSVSEGGEPNGSVTGGDLNAGAAASDGGVAGAGGETPSDLRCLDVKPCGGTLTGDWKIVDSCLQVGGLADVGVWGLTCQSVPVSGVLKVSGSFTVAAGGALVDATRTAGNVQFDFDLGCRIISGVSMLCKGFEPLLEAQGYASAQCSDVGGTCRCDAMVDQTGSMGIVSQGQPVTNGAVSLEEPNGFKTYGVSSGEADYLFCANADRLVAMPSPVPSQGLTGAIVLERR